MISEDLYEEVLVSPVTKYDANTLYIVSGFSTPAMVLHHLEYFRNLRKSVNVSLIIGMSDRNNRIGQSNQAFSQLVENELKGNFMCYYVAKKPMVHAKVYSWYRNDTPICAFVGSANYTQTAFLNDTQMEAMGSTSPEDAKIYFDRLLLRTIPCTDVPIQLSPLGPSQPCAKYEEETPVIDISNLTKVSVSLINNRGLVSARSGLNWGQRPELKRELNQAYIPLKANICSSAFFPPRGRHFTVHTDDGKVIICTRAQDNGKAIETPYNNSILGMYFRRRLGLSSGAEVLLEHLHKYGRTDIDFYMIDEETYYMDFSANGKQRKP